MKVLITLQYSAKTAEKTGKNLVLKLWPKILSANQISAFFNQQYPINRLTSKRK